MSYVGSGILGERLDQPTQLIQLKEQPVYEKIQKSKQLEDINDYDSTKDDESEINFPKPLPFEKISEKIDYFEALRNNNYVQPYQNTMPQPLQPKKQNIEYKKPKFKAEKPKIQKPQNELREIQGQHLDKKPRNLKKEKENTNIGDAWKYALPIHEESDTESHACSQCLCKCFNDHGDLIEDHDGDNENCACGQCGKIYSDVIAKYNEQVNNGIFQKYNFDMPSDFKEPEYYFVNEKRIREQQLLQQQEEENKKKPKKYGRVQQKTVNQQQQNQQQQQQQQQMYRFDQNSYSPSPPSDADIQQKIQHQQRKVERIKQKMEYEKNNLEQNKTQKKQQNNNDQKMNQIQQDNQRKQIEQLTKQIFEQFDYQENEQPVKYDVQQQKQPRLGRIIAENAQEIGKRNLLKHKMLKDIENQKKQMEQEEKENKKKKMQNYTLYVKTKNKKNLLNQKQTPKRRNLSKKQGRSLSQNQKTQTLSPNQNYSQSPENQAQQKYAWGVDQKFLNDEERLENEKLKQEWLQKFKEEQKKYRKNMQKNDSSPDERQQNQEKKPHNYLRSKSNKKQGSKIHEATMQDKVREQKALQLKKSEKQKEKEAQKKRKEELERLKRKTKRILDNTKKIKFVPPEIDEEGEQYFGNRSMSRFNLKGDKDYQKDHNDDDNFTQNLDNLRKKQLERKQQQGNFEGVQDFFEQQDNDNNQLKYEKYKQQYKDEYDDGYVQKKTLDKVFGSDVPPRTYRADDRLVIGFQTKSEITKSKEKDSQPMVQWSEDKIKREIQAKKQIIVKEDINKLQEQREQKKLEKQEYLKQKKAKKDEYDDDGFNIQTREYDQFYDKNRPQYYMKDDPFEEQKLEQEYEEQIQQKQAELIQLGLEKQKKSKSKFDIFPPPGGYPNSRPMSPHQSQENIEMTQDQQIQYKKLLQQQQQYESMQSQQLQQQQQHQHTQQQQYQQQQNNKQPYQKAHQHQDPSKIKAPVRFLDSYGKPLPQEYVQQNILGQAQINDIPKNAKQYDREAYQNEYDQSGYYMDVEKQLKNEIWSTKNAKIKQKEIKKKPKEESSLDRRKQYEKKRQQEEVEKLRKANLDDIFEKGKIEKKYKDSVPEDWGEFDGLELKGTKPYWDEVRGKAKIDLEENGSDSDIYISQYKKQRKSNKDQEYEFEDEEVLDRIERFNDEKVYKNVQKGNHKRIPIDDPHMTDYSQRCKSEKEKRREYEKAAMEFRKNKLDDSDNDEQGGFKKSIPIDFNEKQEKIFNMNSNDILRMGHFEI